ncbi:hypothetical protein [Gabonibacter chumensis]|uniref:hypothetical protein n=1 Tax=Gabonibacter chumensis TaxID=2972474 RepID=UPI002573370D|nr:hypothetical protein [Gabonibacter chumensis]MCR9011053.1 hypothetical protein [Gabonibacter chumensis]
MKKTIQLLVLTLVLLVGGISTNVALGEVIYRTQVCYEGENFTVSFLGVEFDSKKMIYVRQKIGVIDKDCWEVGIDVGIFCYVGVTAEENGIYEFGHHFKDAGIPDDIKLIVELIVLQKPGDSMISRMGKTDDLKGMNHGLLFSRLACIEEKSLVWQSNMFVLA